MPSGIKFILLAFAAFTPFSGLTAEQPKRRVVQFDYGFQVTGLKTGQVARIWIPSPRVSKHQNVKVLSELLPSESSTHVDSRSGNRIIYTEAKAIDGKPIQVKISYQIERTELLGLSQTDDTPLTIDEQKRYLSANQRVPIGKLPLPAIVREDHAASGPVALARDIYNHVDSLVKYDKSKPGYGRGDVLWVCDSRTGNCTDFHSLFISMARNKQLPARFEIGFPLPPERGQGAIKGYHCWAFFHTPENGWVPVDISEADKHPEMKVYYFGNLTENRVAFTVGRDIELVPRQSAPPLNYFVYPHVEVEDKTIDREMIDLDFRYRDVQQDAKSVGADS